MQNTVTFNLTARTQQSVVCKRGPFGNKFVQHGSATLVGEFGKKVYVKFYALCTDDSIEPGRIYLCYATLKGTIVECETVN